MRQGFCVLRSTEQNGLFHKRVFAYGVNRTDEAGAHNIKVLDELVVEQGVGNDEREVVPRLWLELRFALNGVDADWNLQAAQVLNKVGIDAHAVVEKLVAKIYVVHKSHCCGVGVEAIHIKLHPLHKPDDLSSVHNVLVDNVLVALVEPLLRFGDYNATVVVESSEATIHIYALYAVIF